VTRGPALRITAVGSATVQDLGRPGWAHLGVPTSGALDRSASASANRALGNPDGAAVIEVVLGSLTVEAVGDLRICLAGASCPGLAHGEPILLRDGESLRLTTPHEGMRTYLAVAGGIDVPTVLGSRSWDSLSHLGPAPLGVGDELPVGPSLAHPDVATAARPADATAARPFDGAVRLWPGPRAEWFTDALTHLVEHVWTVSADSNRVGLRLGGAPLLRTRDDELPSEGIVTGAVQIPHDGRPIVMLADHPTTGGYPVVAVVDPADLDHLAQVRPGDLLRFRRALVEGRG
jgi:biotin-dependent carboxylase-like uncharacterized protein